MREKGWERRDDEVGERRRYIMSNFPDVLAGYENAAPLGDERNPDGKSLYNPPKASLSPAYDTFPAPIRSDGNGFDFHGGCVSYPNN